MAHFKPSMNLTFDCFIQLDEAEARALNAITVYGEDAFLKAFYEKLGTSYLHQHEKGLRSLFSKIKNDIPGQLSLVDDIKRHVSDFNSPKK